MTDEPDSTWSVEVYDVLDLILAYKIIMGLTSDLFAFVNSDRSTRGHAYKLLQSYRHVDICVKVFSERVAVYLLKHIILVVFLFLNHVFLVLVCQSL